MRYFPLLFFFFVCLQATGQLFVDPVAVQNPDSNNQTNHPHFIANDSLINQLIDSLEQERYIQQKVNALQVFGNYRYPVGKVSVCLDRLVGYNKFEGLKLGLGLETNHHFSRLLTLNGYWRYGLKDEVAKYGGGLSFRLDSASSTRVFAFYQKDVKEDGVIEFQKEQKPFISEQIDVWYRRNFTYHKLFQAGFQSKLFPFLQSKFYWKNYRMLNPAFVDEAIPPTEVLYNNLGAWFRLAFQEHFFTRHGEVYSLGTRFPELQINYERSLPSLSDRNYEAFEFKLSDFFRFPRIGESEIEFLGALRESDGVVNLLASPPSSRPRLFAFYSKNTFATMGINEFVTDRLMAVFWRHNLSPWLFKHQQLKPGIVLAFNAAIGDSKYDDLPGFSERRPSIPKGFYEGGILISKMINTGFLKLGAGAFYRLGPYRFDSFADNLAIKLTVDWGI